MASRSPGRDTRSRVPTAQDAVTHDETEERPLGELLSEMGQKLQTLFSKEVELAKLEIQEQASRAGKAGALFGGMGVVGLLAAILLSFSLAYGLAGALDNRLWLGFLIVGVLYLAVAGALFAQGRKKIAQVSPVPNQTVQTLKQDVETAKASIQRGATGPY